jgi:hypothetical protein
MLNFIGLWLSADTNVLENAMLLALFPESPQESPKHGAFLRPVKFLFAPAMRVARIKLQGCAGVIEHP